MEEYLGQIRSESDPSGIDRDRWVQLIGEHPNLSRPPSQNATNPFTKKPTVIHPPHETARIIIDGNPVGTMTWALDESNGIDVFGDGSTIMPVVEEIARALGGRFRTGDDD
jgi:hypothetical protein